MCFLNESLHAVGCLNRPEMGSLCGVYFGVRGAFRARIQGVGEPGACDGAMTPGPSLKRMSPTVLRVGRFRFFFFSREETRIHVHVESSDGEAKFWLDPQIEAARSHRLKEKDLRRIRDLVVEHEQEIRDAWTRHFGR